MFWTVTCAFGMRAPDASVIVPLRVAPLTWACARSGMKMLELTSSEQKAIPFHACREIMAYLDRSYSSSWTSRCNSSNSRRQFKNGSQPAKHCLMDVNPNSTDVNSQVLINPYDNCINNFA